jgi:hypothetical protein
MTMWQDHWNETVERVRATYNVPPETPREEMWGAISAGMPSRATEVQVVDLDEKRRRRARHLVPASWAAAAAALVVLGIGIGRMTALPGEDPGLVAAPSGTSALELAAREHLGTTESLLTMVRAEARGGGLDPSTAEWARVLLSQTRLLIDARPDGDPALSALLEDLELVLVQIVGLTETGTLDEPRTRTELELALRSLEDGEVLSRIQEALPAGMAGA